MTALQDWLSIRPVDPKGLKSLICDALRSLTADEPVEVAPQSVVRGEVAVSESPDTFKAETPPKA